MMAASTFMFRSGYRQRLPCAWAVHRRANAHARVAGWICIGLAVGVMTCFSLGYPLMPRSVGLFARSRGIETGMGIPRGVVPDRGRHSG
jgi:hypothetical protein